MLLTVRALTITWKYNAGLVGDIHRNQLSRSLEASIIPKTELGYNASSPADQEQDSSTSYDASLFNERYQQQQVQNQGKFLIASSNQHKV